MRCSPGDSASHEALFRLGRALEETGYRFITVSPATHARVNARADAAWAEDLRGVFGWSRPFRAGLLSSPMLELMGDAGVLEPCIGGWRSGVRFSTLGNRLYLHSAYPTDTGEAVFFGPDTYRFARCIEQFLASRTEPPTRVMDIGCGSGVGAITIAGRYPESTVWAGDVNAEALNCTAINAALAKTPNVVPCPSDLLAGASGDFDLIVANPPYLNDADQRLYRHGGGELGARLSLAIIDAAMGRLLPGGSLLLYTGVAIMDGEDPLLVEAERRLRGSGLAWRYAELDPDIFGEELETPAYAAAERIAAVQLIITAPA
jgi:hypothetical protein